MNGKEIILISNWKTYVEGVSDAKMLSIYQYPSEITPIICPPYPLLYMCADNKQESTALGAQNVDVFEKTTTGSIPVGILKETGVAYCIVGHSERRREGETDDDIQHKCNTLIQNNIIPILCIGEHNPSERTTILDTQLRVLEGIAGTYIVAYEPVYAVGAEKPAEAGDIEEAIEFIRGKTQENTKVLYGGSVNGSNALDIIKTGTDGFLLGRASVSIETLNDVVQSICSKQ